MAAGRKQPSSGNEAENERSCSESLHSYWPATRLTENPGNESALNSKKKKNSAFSYRPMISTATCLSRDQKGML